MNKTIRKKLIQIITSCCKPEKIILFGSYARGDRSKNSDIDLLVLFNGLKDERKITGNFYKLLLESDISVPVDILAMDTKKYNALKNVKGYIYRTIKNEGRVLYGI